MTKENIIKFRQKDKEINTNSLCCNQFFFHLCEKEKIIVYDPSFRRYLLRSNYWNTITIYICPWCGKKLPEILADKFFDIIQDELEKCVPADEIYKLPAEFQTDEWWKKRGL